MNLIRLQKFLSQMEICSRREAEQLIRQKKILINQKIATLGDRVQGDEEIKINNQIIKKNKPQKKFIIFHKPLGVECTLKKNPISKTLLDFDFGGRVFSIGRLDKNSRGLLLLTNDGDLANKIIHPSYQHEKEYIVSVDKEINNSILKKISQGVFIDNKKTQPCFCEKIDPIKDIFLKKYFSKKVFNPQKMFRIILKEGKNRQIRKICKIFDWQVYDLLRVRINNIFLGNLKTGTWKYGDHKSLIKQIPSKKI